jgi:hypothetical protein
MTTALESLTKFDWKPQPAAQQLIDGLIADFLARCPGAARLAEQMKTATGTRFVDWVDSIQVPASDPLKARLTEAGFQKRSLPGAEVVYINEGGIFPPVLLSVAPGLRIGIKVEFVSDFLAAWQLEGTRVEGDPGSQFRQALAFSAPGAEMWVVERHGYRGFAPLKPDPAKAVTAQKHLETLRARRRDFETDAEGFRHTNALIDAAIRDLGVDWACDLFFAGEREYWMRRNRAAQVQYARQEKLGLGWANHDHHTYRSSRSNFSLLIRLFEKLGFHSRERFYAGAEAGWGAQVMEQPVTGITTFNDVDMSPEELMGDFAHAPMPERQNLGTVGLWCALHGEALLQAGMHHLEAMFDWHALKDQLAAEAGIRTMDPFTTFPFLRQAFTEGERWPVAEKRIARLLSQGKITAPQAEQFRAMGAIGSHLENLERNDGFKGFNQKGVSDIIARTDPRRQAAAMAGA